MTEEERRLQEESAHHSRWKKWGPYLSERAWGTVREDYSADGEAWEYFPHDHARSRAYRWNEDGLAGICDDNQQLCFALALWNHRDPILKERLFGLTNHEGNHGEDLKELYYYLDNTPTHSYMKCLYKYPQSVFPYSQLVEENRRRNRDLPEFELLDTGVFDDDRYFDVFVEYAKAAPEEILILISIVNRGPDPAPLDVLPTLWFRNTWSWRPNARRPRLSVLHNSDGDSRRDSFEAVIKAVHDGFGTYHLRCAAATAAATAGGGASRPELLFCENDTNRTRLYGAGGRNTAPWVKDGINDYVTRGQTGAINPEQTGTKAAARYRLMIAPGETRTLRLCLCADALAGVTTDAPAFMAVMERRRHEADEFYNTVTAPPGNLTDDTRHVQRQALAGMLWSKQFYHYDVRRWLRGDPGQPAPPDERWTGRNHDWQHLNNRDLLSMPDKWEYPWYASWDLAFHCLPLALVDAGFAKEQLTLLLREWYMHPNGQLPAYEWSFGDVNPPVHAWAALRVYQIERRRRQQRQLEEGGATEAGDTDFLERVFHKLLINFTWWVNRKDVEGRNVYQGGFLGLDNIGVFDRSAPLPAGTRLDQSDGTSWMAMYCLNMLAIALELAREDPTYEDVATKFLEHFFHIAHAMNDRPAARGDTGLDLWDNEDGFYYDLLHFGDGRNIFLRVRSMVGLIPLLAVDTLDTALLEKLPGFRSRLEWFLVNRPDLCRDIAPVVRVGAHSRRLLAVVNADRLRKILARMLDPEEFLSPYGIRALSRHHLAHPYRLALGEESYEVRYEPAESSTGMFGGNSNWRGPVWFPLNYLLIEALQKFDYYYGSEFRVEHPTGSGRWLALSEVTRELSQRLIALFTRDAAGRRPIFGANEKLQTDPHFRDLILFHEYFHGDDGTGLGAAHQTGWTGLVAKLIQQSGE